MGESLSVAKNKAFRADINALRAIAIVGVLLFHYKLEDLQGGFAGVDVFFVISGYLMSKIILTSLSKGEFNYIEYMIKRTQRILPALLFLIVSVTILCFFFYFPADFRINQKNASASSIFLSNIWYWKNSNYFDPSSDTNLFLHTWSLSVEWQFYLLYPIFLWLLKKYIHNKYVYFFLFFGVLIFSFLLSVIYALYNPNASFYLLPTRAWEMLFGGVAFFLEGFFKNVKIRRFLAFIGYICIAFSFVYFDEEILWPSVYTLVPVVATFLIIVSNINYWVIANPVIQFIGKISYSLYLWHWPVYVFARYYGFGAEWEFVILYTVISIALSYLSFRYIESFKLKATTIVVITISVFLGTLGLGQFKTNEFLYAETTLGIAEYRSRNNQEWYRQFRRDVCHVNDIKDFDKKYCLGFKKDKKNILVLGDSHMGQLSNRLAKRLDSLGVNILQATVSGALPTLKNEFKESIGDRSLYDFIYYEFIPKNAEEIDGVILSGHWAGKTASNKKILKGIEEAVKYLEKYKIKTIVIGRTESYIIEYPLIAARDYEYERNTAFNYLDAKTIALDTYLDTNLNVPYIKVINTKSLPPLSKDGKPYMYDKGHVTKYGADLLVDKIMNDSIFIKYLENIENKEVE